MILIKKINQSLNIFKPKRGGVVIRIENYINPNYSTKSSIILSEKEFDELLDSADKMLEIVEEEHEHENDKDISS